MSIGSTSSVSLVTILIRRHFFRKAFADLVKTDGRMRRRLQALDEKEEEEAERHPRHPKSIYRRVVRRARGEHEAKEQRSKGKRGKLTADMIRRVDDPSDASRHLNNGGELLESERRRVSNGDLKADGGMPQIVSEEPLEMESTDDRAPRAPSTMHTWPRRGSEPSDLSAHADGHASPHRTGIPFDRSRTHEPVLTSTRPFTRHAVPHSTTIEFAHDEPDLRRRAIANATQRAETPEIEAEVRMPRARTLSTGRRDAKTGGFGGPPNPLSLAFRFVRDRLPGEHDVWARQASTAMRKTTTQGTMLRRTGTVSSAFTGAVKPAPYITVRSLVLRNTDAAVRRRHRTQLAVQAAERSSRSRARRRRVPRPLDALLDRARLHPRLAAHHVCHPGALPLARRVFAHLRRRGRHQSDLVHFLSDLERMVEQRDGTLARGCFPADPA